VRPPARGVNGFNGGLQLTSLPAGRQALASRTYADLAALTADLPAGPAAAPPAPAQPPQAPVLHANG